MADKNFDWDDAYSNAAYIENGAQYPEQWSTRAAEFRLSANRLIDHAYGDDEREVMDIFIPDPSPAGLVIFVHGGYWMAFDKSYWSDLASGALQQGRVVAIPNYTLAPKYRISEITTQISHAILAAANQFDGPISLVGHSAGGHLVTRMICDDSPLSNSVLGRITRVISISGLHDLRPLMLTSMNETLHLDKSEAELESPLLHTPVSGAEITCWVGASERPQFLQQSRLLANAWNAMGANIRVVEEAEKHHFNVIDGLKDPKHPLAMELVGMGTTSC